MGSRPTKAHEASAPDADGAKWPRRIAWFVAIWAMSVGALGVLAYGLKLWIGSA
jgi:hypothetical protein